MRALKSILIVASSAGLIFLGACNTGNQATNQNSSPASSPAVSESAPSSPIASPAATTKTDHSQPSKGGQVVESGDYHLEFVAAPESSGSHLDLYLLKGEKHETVPGAKVTAQVQLPNGKQQTLALSYDEAGKHYKGMFPIKDPGQYPVKITANVNGEKVEGRFTISQ